MEITVKRRRKRLVRIIAALAVLALIFIYKGMFNGKGLYFTTGFGRHEILQAGSQKAYDYEASILFADVRRQYESLFGSDVWSREIDGQSFETYARQQVRTKLIRVAYMNELADKRGVVLNREESANISKAAKEYLACVDDASAKRLGLTQEQIEQMFTKFAIASRLYNDMTANLQTEVSADYARVITIQYISADSENLINSAKARLDGGESFFYVARDINNGGDYECELRRGEMEKEFEEAAYNLATGETSQIVSCKGRYYIIRCVSDNEKTKTEANKNDIIEARKLEEFNKNFEEYEGSIYLHFNDKLWDKTDFNTVNENTAFEDVFNKYFK